MTSSVAEIRTFGEDLVDIRDLMLPLEFTEAGAGGLDGALRPPAAEDKQSFAAISLEAFAVIFSETVE